MIISFSSYIMMDFLKTILSILVGFFFCHKIKTIYFLWIKIVSSIYPVSLVWQTLILSW